MLVKFFRTGQGLTKSGESVRDYLLNYRTEEGLATLLRGDVEMTTRIINSIQHLKKTYTSGCLSFDAKDVVSEEKKQQLINDFERVLLPSLEPDQYQSYWVQHTDKIDKKTGKPRLELNFVIANVSLNRGTAMTVFNRSSDFNNINMWKDLVNFENGWENPSDPKNVRLVVPTNLHDNDDKGKKKKMSRKDHAKFIESEFEKKHKYLGLKGRRGVIHLIGSLGYRVLEEKDKYIRIDNPKNDYGRNSKNRPIKLKGKMFESDFNFDDYTPELIQERSDTFLNDMYLNAPKMKEELCSRLRNRALYLQKRYYKKDQMNEIICVLPNIQFPADFEQKHAYLVEKLSPPPAVRNEIQKSPPVKTVDQLVNKQEPQPNRPRFRR